MNEYKEFKVGDTVWTVRRGKLKIVGEVLGGSKYNRLWACCKHDGSIHDGVWYPKSENLIPTEAKYKAAMTGGFRVDIAFVTPYNPTVDVKFSASPKFKVGDAVLYAGKKWEVVSIKQRTDSAALRPHIKYDINRQVAPNGGVGACVNESDLRLWKDTKFTQILATQNNGGYGIFNAAHKTPNAYLSFSYLGKMWDGQDVFHCINKEGYSSILFGEKGDDC